jgi:hypothetical protein
MIVGQSGKQFRLFAAKAYRGRPERRLGEPKKSTPYAVPCPKLNFVHETLQPFKA